MYAVISFWLTMIFENGKTGDWRGDVVKVLDINHIIVFHIEMKLCQLEMYRLAELKRVMLTVNTCFA